MTLQSHEEARLLEDKSNDELINIALTEEDEDKAWGAVIVLQFRGTHEVLEAARKLCQSQNSEERRLGTDILGQLGIPDRTFPDECANILLKILENEQDPDVLAGVGMAFGHLTDPRGIKPLIKLKNHPDSDVRFGVVYGLLTQEDELAAKTLIELSQDEDEDVRNWATFGLGTQIDKDTPEIREALLARLTDKNGETQGEAQVGLAVRGDKRVVEPLLKELTSGSVGRMAVESACEIADSRLHSALVELKEWWGVDEKLLDEAIEATSNKNVSV